MRVVSVFLLLLGGLQGVEVPTTVRQGETLRVRAGAPAAFAKMNGRTVRLFPQPDGSRLGLMPVPVPEAPGTHQLEVEGAGGEVIERVPITVVDARFTRQNIVIGREQKELKPSPGEMEAVAALRDTVTDTRHWEELFLRPVPGCQTSPFGVQRWHNGKPTGSYHRGVDQRAATGQPIRAIAGGTVKISRMFHLHGGTVGIDHGQGVTSIYIHMSKAAAREGALVKKGEVIGYAGSTGFSTAPHLHWGIHVNGVAVSPVQWVKLSPCGAAPRPAGKHR